MSTTLSRKRASAIAGLATVICAVGGVTVWATGHNSEQNTQVAAEAQTATSASSEAATSAAQAAAPAGAAGEAAPAEHPGEAPAPEAAPAPAEHPGVAPAPVAAAELSPAEAAQAAGEAVAQKIAGVGGSSLPGTASLNGGPAPAWEGVFDMTGPGGVHGATFASMPWALPLNPAGPQATMVRWVDGWGVSPNNADHGTLYVLGHAWGQQRLVFNPLSEIVTANVNLNAPAQRVPATHGGTVGRYATPVLNGSVITMRDGNGNGRQWVVDNAFLVDKFEAIDDAEIMNAHDKGRIVLIACSVSGGNDLGFNVIVTGHLLPAGPQLPGSSM